MSGCSNEALCSMEKLLSFCDHILEEPLSDQDISIMRDELNHLQIQSEHYKEHLRDQGNHSKSDLSRELAEMLIAEDDHFCNYLEDAFPIREKASEQEDFNAGALCVEYLTDRARQSVREALMGAMNLKIKEYEAKS